MKPILEIRQLGKKYRIRSQSQPYLSLRESIAGLLTRRNRLDDFWALQDVTFDVQAGDTLGIIGRNGAGKSTLLKILSKITPPTKGAVTVRGRIASLLEVGTGFHPELTGRENIYLNGSILGMRRSEITRQFDAILDFAGVQKFVDTPLKHYSSGMQLRLAFAVAAFLEPEILIIDEVLAVGDSEFQKKCIGKMKDVSRQGRTVLFVSHDLSAVSSLTRKSLYLKEGKVRMNGPTTDVIRQYIEEGQSRQNEFRKIADQSLSTPQITRVTVHTSLPNNIHEYLKPLKVSVSCHTPATTPNDSWVTIHITDQHGRGIVHTTEGGENLQLGRRTGEEQIECMFPGLRLYMGSYSVSVYMSGPPGAAVYERLENIANFDVVMNHATHPFGWLPEVCTHIEDTTWSRIA